MRSEENPLHTEKYPVLEPDTRTRDRRVTEIKTYETPQTFSAPRLFKDWSKRREVLKNRILNGCGLLPMPERGSLEVQVFDRKEYEDYSIEKVMIRTIPGYYATGNLYRPLRKSGESGEKFPGILCPHGHWPHGRLEDSDRASVPRRCISFARQGYVCFSYDMVGYADNKKILEHHFAGDREKIWGITPAGFQLWTSLRALDFLLSLPDVDPTRIGCTGASGGGTQTFLLCAVDPRVKVSAPVNMISSTMQGGCDCENPPGIRIDSNNMEIGAMMAPRPMLMVSATGDWTRLTPTVEYPAVRSVYRLYGVPQRVECFQQDAGHNYNLQSRQPVYQWFHRWFYPFRPSSDFVESPDLEIPATSELAIFPAREVPSDVLPKEELFAQIRKRDTERLADALNQGLEHYVELYGPAYRETLLVEEPCFKEIQVRHKAETVVKKVSPELQTWNLEKFLLCDSKTGQEIPAHLWFPAERKNLKSPVLMVHPQGKSAFQDETGCPTGELVAKLGENRPVLTIDCLGTGEFVNDASATNRGEKKGHFATYNLTDTACRIQDILLGEAYLAGRFAQPAEIVGLEGAGGWVLLAHGLAESSSNTVADLSGLDFKEDSCFVNDLYIPNIRRVGDFVTSIALGKDRPVRVRGCADPEMKARIDEILNLVEGN